jgi:hypothetical protein
MTQAQRLDTALALLDSDAPLQRRGRYTDATILVGLGDAQLHLTITAGRITGRDHGPRLMRPWQIAFRASEEAWDAYWQPMPRPGWHDLGALAKRGALVMEGDTRLLLTHLQYFKDLLALPRRLETRS